MRPLRSGLQRHRVELHGIAEARDSVGVARKTWVVLATFWAEVRPLRGAEILNVKQVWATAEYFVNFRWLGQDLPVDSTQRLKVLNSGKILNILNVNNVEERNRSYELVCTERSLPRDDTA